MEEKKTSILAVYKVLEEFSDENHPLTRTEITDLIKKQYNITIDRRTLYRNIEMLINFGYDISDYNENKIGYYLKDRLFQHSEVLLLCNAVHASHFIPDKASKDLVNKLLSCQSRYKRNDYFKNVYLPNKKKKDNKQFLLNIEQISRAINEKKVIKFTYTHYDINKKLVNTRDDAYYRSPYFLVVNGDRVYMVGRGKNHDSLSHFRVDRMKDIELVDEYYLRLPKNLDAYTYANNKIYMFSGDETGVRLRCDKKALDVIIDTFGKDVMLADEGETFTVYTKCGKEDIVKFCLQYVESVELLEPLSLRQEVRKVLLDASNRYQG
ncbi:MAG: WYL domain-containing protein [Erysipelotrichaceae bacterium]|nr:WYL domain-containing protein [Solobacterium sp.]MCI7446220.1 WYL domain-containing protein [Solobacterium sp.]MDY5402154.1 WYL domain-containing protein [Erysipelotrichaceae bacterium]